MPRDSVKEERKEREQIRARSRGAPTAGEKKSVAEGTGCGFHLFFGVTCFGRSPWPGPGDPQETPCGENQGLAGSIPPTIQVGHVPSADPNPASVVTVIKITIFYGRLEPLVLSLGATRLCFLGPKAQPLCAVHSQGPPGLRGPRAAPAFSVHAKGKAPVTFPRPSDT